MPSSSIIWEVEWKLDTGVSGQSVPQQADSAPHLARPQYSTHKNVDQFQG